MNQLLRQVNPSSLRDGQRRRAQVLLEEPAQLSPADPHSLGEALDVAGVESAIFDERESARDRVGGALPRADVG